METKKIYSIILYYLASLLPLCLLQTNFKVTNHEFVLYGISILITTFVYIISHVKYRKSILFIMILGICIYIYLNLNMFYNAILYIYNALAKAYNSYTNIGFSLADLSILKMQANEYARLILYFLQLFLSLCNYVLIFKKNNHFLIFIISLIFCSSSLIIQIEMNWIVFLLVVIFWIMLFLPSVDKKIYFTKKVHAFQLLVIVLSISLAGTFFLNKFPEGKITTYYEISDRNQEIISSITNFFKGISTIQSNSNSVNLMNAKNRYYTGAIHLEVTREKRETLYLKYYSGAKYENNRWTPLDDEAYKIDNDDIFLNSFQWIRKSSNDYETISVIDYRKGSTFSIFPYYLKEIDQTFENKYDIYMRYKEKEAYFQVWNPNDIENERKSSYSDFVKDNYRKIPYTIKEYFKEELQLNYLSVKTIEDAKNTILDILKEYKYTLYPGETPEDKDFVLYFLEENKEGYCVHFASAATLMFRYFGIPARYVEGYCIEEHQFDENMHAEVKDSDSHAWVEVFDENCGWIPIEVTVSNSTTKPDDPETPDEPDDNPTVNNPVDRPNQQPNPNHSNQTPGIVLPGNETETENGNLIKIVWISGIILFFGMLALIYQLRKRLRYKRMTQKDIHKSVCEIYRYVDKISKSKKFINEDIYALFEKNRFSKEGISIEERDFILNYVQKETYHVYQSLSFTDRLIFKYVKALI